MNYTEITDTALSFADREDDEVTSRMDKFLLMVESKINRKLKVGDMSARATIDLSAVTTDKRYFAVPVDFGGLRSIKIVTGAREMPLKRLSPEQMTHRVNSDAFGVTGDQVYFNLVAKQIQIYPPRNEGLMEITYYQKVPPLTVAAPNNWLGDDHPDCYIDGLVAEISAFAKDADAFAIWDLRFNQAVEEIQNDDLEERWSGTPMEVRVG
jgi:hypothetical protein